MIPTIKSDHMPWFRNQHPWRYLLLALMFSLLIVACDRSFTSDRDLVKAAMVDGASIHTSDALYNKLTQWQQCYIEIFQLPRYLPQLNLIEILWRFIKYEWLEISAYRSWQSLVK